MARRVAPSPPQFDPALIKELAGCYARAAVRSMLAEQKAAEEKKSSKKVKHQTDKEMKS